MLGFIAFTAVMTSPAGWASAARAEGALVAAETITANDAVRVVFAITVDGLTFAAGQEAFPTTTRLIDVAPGVYAADAPDHATALEWIRRLRDDATVRIAEIDHRYHASILPNDPCVSACQVNAELTRQWYLDAINVASAWDVTTGSAQFPVAVVDTGVQASHSELTGKVIGTPCSPLSDSTTDGNGHGTFVAGLITARTNNSNGISGVGWDTPVIAVKALSEDGSALSSDLARGITCAVDSGARVVNLSIEGNLPSFSITSAVEYAFARNVVVVAAGGNFYPNLGTAPIYPAALPGVIGVGATNETPSDSLASFSDRGPWMTMAAPGSRIVSLCSPGVSGRLPGRIGCPTGYTIASGTSFSAPIVSAAAALVWTANPQLSAGQLAERLKRSTRITSDVAGGSYRCGVLDVAAAVRGTSTRSGYWVATTTGAVIPFGSMVSYGDVGGSNNQVSGIAAMPGRCGYWIVSKDGKIDHFGEATDQPAGFTGSVAGPIVGIACTPSGRGYWLVNDKGRVYNYGDAGSFGGTTNLRLNAPITGLAVTPSGAGYWLVARDGGIFAFGDARFFGSMGNIRLNQPVFTMAPTPTGRGYWLVARDGGIFAFGDARFFGSTGDIALNQPIVASSATTTGGGYWLLGADGGVFSFGDAPFLGSLPGLGINTTVASMAS